MLGSVAYSDVAPDGTSHPTHPAPPLCRECGKRVHLWQSYSGWGGDRVHAEDR